MQSTHKICYKRAKELGWGQGDGLVTSAEELQQILKTNGDYQEKIVWTELSYYWDTQVIDHEHTRSLQVE